jgi:probable rRNA maturation factor
VKRKPARKSARKSARKAPTVTVIIDDEGWRKDPAMLRLIRRAARLALDHRPRRARTATLLLTSDRHLRELNHQFRGKDKSTNVLSFVSDDLSYWGDVAIALGVVRREAREQRKSVPAHAAHLTIHGLLHLKGYDHTKKSDRDSMEGVEILILSKLGLSDPYAPRPYTRPAKAVN